MVTLKLMSSWFEIRFNRISSIRISSRIIQNGFVNRIDWFSEKTRSKRNLCSLSCSVLDVGFDEKIKDVQFLVFCLFVRNGTLLWRNGCGPIVLFSAILLIAGKKTLVNVISGRRKERHLGSSSSWAGWSLGILCWLVKRFWMFW